MKNGKKRKKIGNPKDQPERAKPIPVDIPVKEGTGIPIELPARQPAEVPLVEPGRINAN